MIDLITIVNEGSMMCEAFADPRLYQAWKSLHDRYKINWKDIFTWGAEIAWDKIDKDDIEEFDASNIDNLFKQARKVKAGKDERPFVVLGMKNEEFDCAFDAAQGSFKEFRKSYSGNGYVDSYTSDRGKERMAQSSMFQRLKECDYVYKIYLDEKSVGQIKRDRRDAKNGAFFMSDADHHSMHTVQGELGKNAGGLDRWRAGSFYRKCLDIADEARSRYKKILADRAFQRDQDTKEVDDAVNSILIRLTTATSNAMKDPKKYDLSYGVSGKLEKLMKMVYDKYSSYSGKGGRSYITGHDELLVLYQNYCDCVIKLKNNKDSYYSSMPEWLANRNKYKKAIMERVSVLDKMLKEFDA